MVDCDMFHGKYHSITPFPTLAPNKSTCSAVVSRLAFTVAAEVTDGWVGIRVAAAEATEGWVEFRLATEVTERWVGIRVAAAEVTDGWIGIRVAAAELTEG